MTPITLIIIAALLSQSPSADLDIPFRTIEQHATAAAEEIRYTRIEFHDVAKAHKAGRRHARWHRIGWYSQLADVATTAYALCALDGYEESNAFLSAYGDCNDTILAGAKAIGLIAFMEWNENRERRKHGCESGPCPPILWKHLSRAWRLFSVVGFVPAGMNINTMLDGGVTYADTE